VKRLCSRCGLTRPMSGRCPHCGPAHDMAKVRSRRTTARWERLRLAVLERDNHRCRICGSASDLTVHLHPDLRGDHDLAEAENCFTLCRSCHGRVDAPRASRSA
jgi:5-methylcytosine-specific restriction endonuclease McrA